MAEKISVKLEDVEQALRRSERAVYEPGFEARSSGDDPTREQFLIELRDWQRTLETTSQKQNVFGSIDDRGVSLLQSYLAREGNTHGGDVQPTKDGFEAKFDNLDPGWIWSLHDWIKGLFKHDFLPAPSQPDTVANDYRIAVLSDWGTGLYGAPVCAKSIENDKDHIDMVLHLGDIYYAGDDDEVKERFLTHWPQHPGAANRALNGNHEMYTGGKAYYDLILKDPKFNQPASYFALRNDHWLVVALDTGYEEHDLYGGQAAWLEKLAAESPALPQKSGLRLFFCRFNALNLTILVSILTFEAKPRITRPKNPAVFASPTIFVHRIAGSQTGAQAYATASERARRGMVLGPRT